MVIVRLWAEEEERDEMTTDPPSLSRWIRILSNPDGAEQRTVLAGAVPGPIEGLRRESGRDNEEEEEKVVCFSALLCRF